MPELSLSKLLAQLAELARPERCNTSRAPDGHAGPGLVTCGLSRGHGGRHYDRKVKVFFD